MECQDCDGSGYGAKDTDCLTCNGTGNICDVCGESCEAGTDICFGCDNKGERNGKKAG